MFRLTDVIALLLWLLPFTLAAAVNYTIDDTNGDSRTQLRPTYFPNTGGIWEDPACYGGVVCSIKPDPSKAFMGTYTAATYRFQAMQNMSITMDFEGIAIYVFFILPNQQGPNVDTTTMANFTIDGELVGNFTHVADLSTNDILYNQTVFHMTGLSNGFHRLIISTSGIQTNVYVNFDYAIYTHLDGVDASNTAVSSTRTGSATAPSATSSGTTSANPSGSESSSKNTPVGAIAGGTVGGAIVIAGLLTFAFWRRRRNRKAEVGSASPFLDLNPNEHSNSTDIKGHPRSPQLQSQTSGGLLAPVSKSRQGDTQQTDATVDNDTIGHGRDPSHAHIRASDDPQLPQYTP